MNVTETVAATVAWIAPLGRSLQSCNPRWRRRCRIVDVSVALLSLMQELQLHRGLSCAVIDDQADFSAELDAAGAKLQRSLGAFDEQFSEREAVFRSDDWQSILARWDSLRRNWHELDFHTNLAVHSQLVLDVVDVLRTLAYANDTALVPVQVSIISEWPTMVEHLGVLRAIGLHRCRYATTQLDPDTLRLFREHLHEARSTLAAVEALFANEALLGSAKTATESAAELRDAIPPGVDSQTYYAQMTGVIDTWYAHIRGRLYWECGRHGDSSMLPAPVPAGLS